MSKNIVTLLLGTNKYKVSNLTKCVTASRNVHTSKVKVKEIQIPARYPGHIAAKLWGNDNEQPMLALHGWQDNAGTWDTLAPMLCDKRPILAIDFPGHGLSSWYPKGMQYYPWDLPRFLMYIQNYFKWKKISLLSHSMGSIAAMRFACVFPDAVDFYVAIDSFIYDDYDLDLVIDNIPETIKKTEITQSRLDTAPPCYSLDEAIERWHQGTRGSVAKESVPYLLERGSKRSATDPNKYFISRDPRLKNSLFCPEDKQLVKALLSRLKCPTLYIKGKDSPYASDNFTIEMRETIGKSNPNFEIHFVPGTHHLHLNNPERVAPLIVNFLQKYKFIT